MEPESKAKSFAKKLLQSSVGSLEKSIIKKSRVLYDKYVKSKKIKGNSNIPGQK